MPLVTDEPDALIGLVRVCGGSGEQSLLLPGNLPGISKLKYDFGADSFNMQNFNVTEAAMNCVMLAYNLMSLFRQVVLHNKA